MGSLEWGEACWEKSLAVLDMFLFISFIHKHQQWNATGYRSRRHWAAAQVSEGRKGCCCCLLLLEPSHIMVWAAGEALLEEDAKVQGLKEEAVVCGGSWWKHENEASLGGIWKVRLCFWFNVGEGHVAYGIDRILGMVFLLLENVPCHSGFKRFPIMLCGIRLWAFTDSGKIPGLIWMQTCSRLFFCFGKGTCLTLFIGSPPVAQTLTTWSFIFS